MNHRIVMLILSIAMIALTSCKSEEKEPEQTFPKSTNKLYGPVKTVMVRSYDAKQTPEGDYIPDEETKVLRLIEQYDREGKLLEQRTPGRSDFVKRNIYNADDSLEKVVITIAEDTMELAYIDRNEAGYRTHEYRCRPDTTGMDTITVVVYEYDKKNRVKLKTYYEDGIMDGMVGFGHYDNGREKRVNHFDGNRRMGSKEVWFYNKEGYPLRHLVYGRKRLSMENKYKYTDEGHLAQISTDFMGRKMNTIVKYKVDDHNNWIVRTVFRNGQPVQFFVRTISYYEDESS